MKYKAIVGVIGMTRHVHMMRVFLAVVVALILGAAAPAGWADDDDDDEDEIPFDVAKLFFQLNDTDGDLGIHADVDGEAWKKLEIEDPRGRRMLVIGLSGRLRRQGLTEFSFESAEPTFDELPPEKFFRRFPEGEYEIEGRTLDGEERESTVMISHVMPAPPSNLQVSGKPTVCDDEEVTVVSKPITISWAAVTGSHPTIGKSGDIDVVRYEVAVEREEPTTLILTADVPPSITELVVPSALLMSRDEIKFQILVTDGRGNETSSESCFVME